MNNANHRVAIYALRQSQPRLMNIQTQRVETQDALQRDCVSNIFRLFRSL